jgi:hypothetical protein
MTDTTCLKQLMKKDGIDNTTQNSISLFLKTLMNETFFNQVINDIEDVGKVPSIFSIFGIVLDMASYHDSVLNAYRLLNAIDKNCVHKYVTFAIVCVVADAFDIESSSLVEKYDEYYKFFDVHFAQSIKKIHENKKTKISCSC